MSAHTESDHLHSRVRAVVSAYESRLAMPESFDAIACDIARYQASNIPGYATLCKRRGIDPDRIHRASEAPAVPTDLFKLTRVAAFESNAAVATFRTSGTTEGADSRGAHSFRTLETYNANALAFGKRSLLGDAAEKYPFLIFGPPPNESSDSSLMHMVNLFAEHWGSERTYLIENGNLNLTKLSEKIAAFEIHDVRSVFVLGTSFAFVHLLDALDGATMPLPKGSRVMHTGGFKGKSRTVPPEELLSGLSAAFAISPRRIVSEYGMTELSSQFYEHLLVHESAERGVFFEPPWARVVPVDPETLAPVAEGEVGVARIEDLANIDSAFAIVTHDRVRRTNGGFQLLGRAPGAQARGCSIAIDEMLGG